jgi:peroxiredoxin
MPGVALPSTRGDAVDLSHPTSGRTVVYLFPWLGNGEVEPPQEWNLIPGARGCTPESCSFRDHHAELARLGASVFGLSSQPIELQREAAERLHLPFPLLCDSGGQFSAALKLPTFKFHGQDLLARLTMIVNRGAVEHVFYPVFPPDEHAAEVSRWLRDNPG